MNEYKVWYLREAGSLDVASNYLSSGALLTNCDDEPTLARGGY